MTEPDTPTPLADDQALRAKRMRAYTELGLGLSLRPRAAAVTDEGSAFVREPLRQADESGPEARATPEPALPSQALGGAPVAPAANGRGSMPAPPIQPSSQPVSKEPPSSPPLSRPLTQGDPLAGLEALQATVAACQACGLCKTRKQTVFAAGNPLGELAIVGEAPGAEEDRTGQAFVGNAGKLLDNMLASLALNRQEHAYICNVIKCRPPENRDPEPEEVARCEVYLQQQLGLVRPRIILVVGRFAAQSLLRTDASIASLRGRVHAYAVEGRRVPVVVTYHPAYLLRNLGDKAKAWADLCLLKAELTRLGQGG